MFYKNQNGEDVVDFRGGKFLVDLSQPLYGFEAEVTTYHDEYYIDDNFSLKHFDVTEDGSISEGVELVSRPFNLEDFPEIIKELSKIKAEFDCSVDTSCGLHVHAGLNHLPKSVWSEGYLEAPILANLMICGDALFNLMAEANPRSRRDNSFCEKVYWPGNMQEPFNQLQVLGNFYGFFPKTMGGWPHGKDTCARYKWLNLHSIKMHKTVENRMPAGTLDGRKIWGWCKVTGSILDFAIKTPFREMDDYMKNGKVLDKYIEHIGQEEKDFLKNRLEKLSPTSKFLEVL